MYGWMVMTHLKFSHRPVPMHTFQVNLRAKRCSASTECSGYFSESFSYLLSFCILLKHLLLFQDELLVYWNDDLLLYEGKKHSRIIKCFLKLLSVASFSLSSGMAFWRCVCRCVCALFCPLSCGHIQNSQMWLCSEQNTFHRSLRV